MAADAGSRPRSTARCCARGRPGGRLGARPNAAVQDLSSLKIDRSATRSKQTRRRPGRGNPWVARIVVMLVVGTAIGLFYRPIFRFIDLFRLPTVQTAVVQKSHPAMVGAVQGTAANGHVVAYRRAALSADTPGRIVELNVTEGTVLKKGDVVARLYFKVYAAALERAGGWRCNGDHKEE